MTMLRQTCDMSVELDRGSIFAPETHCIIIVYSSFKRKPQQAILGRVCFEIDSDPDIDKNRFALIRVIPHIIKRDS